MSRIHRVIHKLGGVIHRPAGPAGSPCAPDEPGRAARKIEQRMRPVSRLRPLHAPARQHVQRPLGIVHDRDHRIMRAGVRYTRRNVAAGLAASTQHLPRARVEMHRRQHRTTAPRAIPRPGRLPAHTKGTRHAYPLARIFRTERTLPSSPAGRNLLPGILRRNRLRIQPHMLPAQHEPAVRRPRLPRPRIARKPHPATAHNAILSVPHAA